MKILPVRSALDKKNGYVCLPCLLRRSYVHLWNQQRRSIILPSLDPNIASDLAAEIDKSKETKEKAKKKHRNVITKLALTKVKESRKGNTSTSHAPNTKTGISLEKKTERSVLSINNTLTSLSKALNEEQAKALDKQNVQLLGKINLELGSLSKSPAAVRKKDTEQISRNVKGLASCSLSLSKVLGKARANIRSREDREKSTEKIVGGHQSESIMMNASKCSSPSLSKKEKPTADTQGANKQAIPDEPIPASNASAPEPSKARKPTTSTIRKIVPQKPSRLKKSLLMVKEKNVAKPDTTRPTRIEKSLSDAIPSWQGVPLLEVSEVKGINAADLNISAIEIDQQAVPALSYGLERVLFNPGVYQLQDPRSKVFNFDPYLQTIMPVAEFDFSALKGYITSSEDHALGDLARKYGKRYVGSSSSMTGILAQFHFLLSKWRPVTLDMLSKNFPASFNSFTVLQRAPSAVFLRWQNGTYAVDMDKEFGSANILSMLGKSMEKLLTLKTDAFERYRISNTDSVSEKESKGPETFHYSAIGDFLMRSQLDAHDYRLPGTGMFDLKTRAVVSVRMDASNHQEVAGYEIRSHRGEWESFEREYYDMIRSAFLKYSLQVRMGRMDGVFVAYHNTERIFGFQYIPLEEMDVALHGQSDKSLGDQEFKISVDLLNKVLDRAIEKFPEQSLRIHFETRDSPTPFMYIFAEPTAEERIDEMQNQKNAEIEEFERRILGLSEEPAEVQDEENNTRWEEIQANVQEAMDRDEKAAEEMSEAVELLMEPDTFDEMHDAMGHQSEDHGSEHRIANHRGIVMADETGDDGEGLVKQKIDTDDDAEAGAAYEEGLVEEDVESEVDAEAEAFQKEGTVEEDVDSEVDAGAEAIDGHESVKVSGDRSDEAISVTADESSVSSCEIGDREREHTALSDKGEDAGESKVESEAEEKSSAETSPSLAAVTPRLRPTADTVYLNRMDAAYPRYDSPPQILAMILTIRNKVDDAYVSRPTKIFTTSTADQPKSRWRVEYTLAEVERQSRAWALYRACQVRRRKALADDDDGEGRDARSDYYVRKMRELAKKGRSWRMEEDARIAREEKEGAGKKVLGVWEEERGKS